MRNIPTIMKLIVLTLLIQLTGCGGYATTLQHPETGERQTCVRQSGGLLYGVAGGFQAEYDECVAAYKGIGYIPIEDGK